MRTSSRRIYQKYQSFLVPIGLIVLCLIVFFFGITAAAKETIKLFQDAKVVEDEVIRLKQKLAVLEQLDEGTLENQLLTATSAIPLDKSLPTVLRTIEGLSAQTQVTIANVSMVTPGSLATESARALTAEEKQFGMFFIPFTVYITGTFDQLHAFLQLSTAVRRFVRARSFTLNFTTGDQITTQVAFDAFYAPITKTENQPELQQLQSEEQQIISKLISLPNIGEIPVALDSAEQIPQNQKSNPFAL